MAALREILQTPDPRLRRISQVVDDFSKVQALVDDLIHTMFWHRAVGLAAPQIGEAVRIFVLDAAYLQSQRDSAIVFVNPEVVGVSSDFMTVREGCLSFPGTFLRVRRPRWVTVSAQDRNGVSFQVNTGNDRLFGQAVLHEHDHLDGRLMVDHQI